MTDRERFEAWFEAAHNAIRQAIYELDSRADRIDQLERELAKVRDDAERYRWLRSRDMDICDNQNGDFLPAGGGLEEELDAYIDAARQAERDGK